MIIVRAANVSRAYDVLVPHTPRCPSVLLRRHSKPVRLLHFPSPNLRGGEGSYSQAQTAWAGSLRVGTAMPPDHPTPAVILTTVLQRGDTSSAPLRHGGAWHRCPCSPGDAAGPLLKCTCAAYSHRQPLNLQFESFITLRGRGRESWRSGDTRAFPTVAADERCGWTLLCLPA